jgi:hypothetical protein
MYLFLLSKITEAMEKTDKLEISSEVEYLSWTFEVGSTVG